MGRRQHLRQRAALRLVAQTGLMLVVDAANVIGSRPTGWWKDRAGAARSFVADLRTSAAEGRLTQPVVVVLEGKARGGVSSGAADGVTVVHATGSGDDALVDVVRGAPEGEAVVLVTADRELRQRAVALRAEVVGPKWLLERLA
jgi:hypothetical protein